jgi:hypothetical protein
MLESRFLDHAEARFAADTYRLGVQYPFLAMFPQLLGLVRAVRAVREFGVLERRSKSCATGKLLLGLKGIGAQFGQNRIWFPAWMGATLVGFFRNSRNVHLLGVQHVTSHIRND